MLDWAEFEWSDGVQVDRREGDTELVRTEQEALSSDWRHGSRHVT